MSAWRISPMSALEAITCLHRGEGAAVAFARSAPDGWQECGAILATELHAKWSSVESALEQNSYFGLSSTYAQRWTPRLTTLGLPQWSRRAEHLRWLNAAAVDLDHHDNQNFSSESLLAAFWEELVRQEIPSPTFLSFSGRGLWALWQLVDHANRSQPVPAFPEKRAQLSRINKELVAKFRSLGADPQCTDPARVMRLPDSLNTKAAVENSHVRFFRASEVVYTLPELNTALSLPARKVSVPGERERKHPAKANAALIRWRRPLDGFRALWKMRGTFIQGTRHQAVYVYAMLLRKNRVSPNEILEECRSLAESLEPTISDAEVKHAVMSSAKAITYKFRNETLASKLKMTSAERAALPGWFKPKTQDKSSRIAERRDLIRLELELHGKSMSTRGLVTLLLEKHGLRVSQFTVLYDKRFLAERFPLAFGTEALPDKQKKTFSTTDGVKDPPSTSRETLSAEETQKLERTETTGTKKRAVRPPVDCKIVALSRHKSKGTMREKSKSSNARLLTVPQAVVYSGLSAWKLRQLIHDKLPIVELNEGNKFWIDRRDLDALIERSKRILS